MSSAELDAAIIDAVRRGQRKVAMVIGKVGKLAEPAHGEAAFDAVEARIAVLVAAGKLIAVGDTAEWRHSEIGLAS